MPIFSPNFYSDLQPELTLEQKSQTDLKLQNIYREPSVDYQAIQDFDQCKKQLLALLTHIAQLNPRTLAIFAAYRAKVDALLPTTAEVDINITLKVAKSSLENALLDIEANYVKLDTGSLSHLKVGVCYSGAFSNIESAIGYFRPNALAQLVSFAKRHTLLQLATEFMKLRIKEVYKGNEIHYANTLFNHLAPVYGLPLQQDFFTTIFSDVILEHMWREIFLSQLF